MISSAILNQKCESLTRIISSKNSEISVAFVNEFKIGENVIVYEFEAKGAKVIAKDSQPVWNAYLHKWYMKCKYKKLSIFSMIINCYQNTYVK